MFMEHGPGLCPFLTKAHTDLSLLLASRCQQLAQEAPSPPRPEHQSSGLQGQEVQKACTAHSTITSNVATIEFCDQPSLQLNLPVSFQAAIQHKESDKQQRLVNSIVTQLSPATELSSRLPGDTPSSFILTGYGSDPRFLGSGYEGSKLQQQNKSNK